ncbi:MAG: hypothetical protein ACO2OR_02125 [Desulfurococcaceae archaeon]
MRALWILQLCLLVLAVTAPAVAPAEEHPVISGSPFYGRVGYDLYVIVFAPIEMRVNTSVTISVSVWTFERDVYVYYLDFHIWYPPVVTIPEEPIQWYSIYIVLLNETWIPARSKREFYINFTPLVPSEISARIGCRYYSDGGEYEFWAGFTLGIARRITYNELLEAYSRLLGEYRRLREVYEELLRRYRELEANYTQLQRLYSDLLSNYTRLLELYESPSREYEELRSLYASLSANYTALLEQYRLLEESYRGLSERHGELARLYDSLLSNYTHLSSLYSSLLDEYARLKSLYEEYARLYSQLSEQYSELSAEYAQLEEHATRLLEENRSLQRSVEEHAGAESRYLLTLVSLSAVTAVLVITLLAKTLRH